MLENNNKYKNLLLLNEDDQQVYLCPSEQAQSPLKSQKSLPSQTKTISEQQSISQTISKSNNSSNNEQNEKRLLAEFKKNSLKTTDKSVV